MLSKRMGNEYAREESRDMDVLFYADSRGHQEVYDWIQLMKERERSTFRKTIHMITYLKENGKLIQSGAIKRDDIKKLKDTDGMWQLRINENRILFFYYAGDSIVLTKQFKKKSQKTPAREVKVADRRKNEWIQRNP